MNSKRKIIIVVMSSLTFILLVLGITYAFFDSDILGNEEASSMVVELSDISMTFNDGSLLTFNDGLPGASKTKTFSVTNTGDKSVQYDIVLTDVYSEIVREDVVYTLTSTNSGGSITSKTILPTTDAAIVTKVVIPSGVTQVYTLTIIFQNLPRAQDYNQGADFRGTLRLISPYEVTTSNIANQNITLIDRIKLDNTIYADNVQSKYVTSPTGIDYDYVSGYNYTDNYSVKTVNMSSDSNMVVATDYSFDQTSGTYTLVNYASGQSYQEGKYTCADSWKTWCTTMYKITKVSGTTAIEVEEYIGKRDSSVWNGQGLYSTSDNTIGNLPTYFFRGNVQNNYVVFANNLWRIVRITEEGTIKIIKQTKISDNAFNDYTTYDKKYIGYVYDSNTPSTIKEVVDDYANLLNSYSSYLDTNYTCNDRQTSQTAFTYYYGPYNRRLTTPQYKCENADRISASAGLLSFDEVKYAGGSYRIFSQNLYLNNYTHWWFSSPLYATSDYGRMVYMIAGGLCNLIDITTDTGVRPVVTLKSSVLTTGGNGSSTYPYTTP